MPRPISEEARGRLGESPTVPPPSPSGLATVLDRNIHALQVRRQREEEASSLQDGIANAVTRFTGSMAFIYIHLAAFGFWIVANLGAIPGVRPWDSSFVILATEASVEAIFLSTFVLISQNRAAAAAERRANLDLQINLLAEHEVTRLLTLSRAIAEKLGIDVSSVPDLPELQRDVAPEAVLDEMEEEDDRS
jgi:uncharacterized membrane protein